VGNQNHLHHLHLFYQMTEDCVSLVDIRQQEDKIGLEIFHEGDRRVYLSFCRDNHFEIVLVFWVCNVAPSHLNHELVILYDSPWEQALCNLFHDREIFVHNLFHAFQENFHDNMVLVFYPSLGSPFFY
jgi:hypothetical protein